MRIIGGEFRSRVLADFVGQDVRPTSDRAREALFNILSFKIRDARVMDLFSGSGAIGIESLSRGAKEVVFNDFAKDSVAIIKKNVSALKIPAEKAIVYNYDYMLCLQLVKGQFDFVFIDPPYFTEYGKKALEEIAKRDLLTKDGVAVYEWDRGFSEEIKGLEKFDERKYGKAIFSFFRKKV